ncbi:D-alanyl-D-alanine carboxypeptidase family protein [Antarcticimicrobium sediminis]|uniref:serine-type D-Ala-D-Ala carboxypeptidase n=1 Tax=Antarcticimicrobium sediminis TaxID=2546227 RepID=A0A4R5EM48_9RHOB|nr:D-alanyl-D-alanine carboxypeptidase family protein [Antarcticimicrobium sediminis]TDE35632.1 D-alanyl-D-alanine carboxypeptidase [Antarcticimicrobium sediminis]
MLLQINPRLSGALRLTVLAFATVLWALPAAAFETRARAAYILDQGTGTVLLSKNPDQPLPPASMSKLMTLYVAFEALRDGRLTLDEKLPVSEHAMSYGGSTMFLDTTDRVRVEDLLRGIIVLSGNDACAVIAEALSPDGTEAGFARYMTQRAQQIGMTNSTFANSNGWPAAGHRMSVHDLAVLARHIITDFPQYYSLFSETEFAFDGRAPSNTHNRNPLLHLGVGADGLKTGHTEEAGYGLVGSAKQGDRRVIFVLFGLGSKEARADEAEAVVNWSFRQFAEKIVLRAETPVAQAKVFMGREPEVNLVATEDVTALLPALSADKIEAEVVYTGPIHAPITKGDQLGELVLKPEGLEEIRRPLVADRTVPTGGFTVRVQTAARALVTRFVKGPEGTM